MYPGAMTVLIPRFIVCLFAFLIMAILCRIFLICHDIRKPMGGCRTCLIRMSFAFWIRLCIGIGLFGWLSNQEYDIDSVDYSPYLGPTWKEELKEYMDRKEPDSMWVSNHIGGFFDVSCFLTGPTIPAFTPLEKFRKIPIFGYICEAIQCVWIDRGAPKAQLDKMVEAVGQR